MTQTALVTSNAAAKAAPVTPPGRDGNAPDSPGGFTDVLRERQAAQAAHGNDRKPAGDAGAEETTSAQDSAALAATAGPEDPRAMPGADPAQLPPPDPASLPPAFFLNLIERAAARADGGEAAHAAGATPASVNGTGRSASELRADGAMPRADSMPSAADGVRALDTPRVARDAFENAIAAWTRAAPPPGTPAASADALTTARAGRPAGGDVEYAATVNAAAMQAAAPTEAARNSAATSPRLSIDAPVGSPGFTDETAQQVTWLAKNGIEHAEIRVKPAEMGPISVRIEMHGNEALISFAVTQPDTRVAVEDAMHRLEEMLAESGIALGQANVGGQDGSARAFDDTPSRRSRVTFGASAAAAVPATGMRSAAARRGMVDTFA